MGIGEVGVDEGVDVGVGVGIGLGVGVGVGRTMSLAIGAVGGSSVLGGEEVEPNGTRAALVYVAR